MPSLTANQNSETKSSDIQRSQTFNPAHPTRSAEITGSYQQEWLTSMITLQTLSMNLSTLSA